MKKNVVIIILVILLLGMGGYLVYDKVIDKNVDKKEELVETKDIKVGEVGKINSEVESWDCGEEKGTVKIENGKLVYISKSGKKIEDTSLNEKAISIVFAMKGCSCDSSSFIVLTEKGNVYYNYLVDDNDFSFKFNLKKVISNQKIYGIDALNRKGPTSCGNEDYYVYVNDDTEDARIIMEYDISGNINPYIGDTYYSIYPYEESSIIDLSAPYLASEKDGKLKIIAGDYRNAYLIYEGNYIYVNSKENISKMEYNEKNKYGYKITDKNNNSYELTFTLDEYFNINNLELIKIK